MNVGEITLKGIPRLNYGISIAKNSSCKENCLLFALVQSSL